MAAFSPLLSMLAEVLDPCRVEDKLYTLPYTPPFPIFTVVGGCTRIAASSGARRGGAQFVQAAV